MTNKDIKYLNKLKFIFNSISILRLTSFFNKFFYPSSYIKHIEHSIQKFLACRDIQKGYLKLKCHKCQHLHTISLTCKSRLCPTCGFKYSQVWTQKIAAQVLNINHRHVLFTIPKQCRMFFFYDRTLLVKLSHAVNEVFKYQFHNIYKKKQRVNYIPPSSDKYFTDADVVHYGLLTVIHTFGRDLKWNPHIHAIVSLGGFNKHFKFKKFDYFNVSSIAGQWKYHVLDIIKNGSYPNEKIKRMAKKTVSELYEKDTRFFFNVGNGDVNNTKGIIKYLGRYLARSPIAEYKITTITDDEVTFVFDDLKTGEKQQSTMNIERFAQQVLVHLPPKNFKMVNRYGFYARRICDKLKLAIKPFMKNISKPKFSFYQSQMYITFGINPFYCPNCKVRMRVWEFYHYRYPAPRRYY